MRVVAFVAFAAVMACASAQNFSCTTTSATFRVSTCDFTAPGGEFVPGINATLKLTGTVDDKIITAGTVKWQWWEDEVEHYVGQGDESFFECTNKGCDPAKPVALSLANPSDPRSAFVVNAQMPLIKGQQTDRFHLVAWAQDQDHTPYDFDATIVMWLACKTDADCPPGSYCETWKPQPWQCH